MGWVIRLMVAATLLAASPAFADSWMPAERKSYLSSDKATRLTVVPRDLENQLAYFSDKVEGKEPAGQRRGGEPRALGILERRSGQAWTKVWEGPLVNEVAPVHALVANGGGHVVTFDNWHSAGFGDNVVVIYRGDGSVVRTMKLADILPEDYVRALPTSVSSMWWGGEHELSRDGRQVVLKVVVPSGRGSIGSPRGFVDVTIDLATGAVVPLAGPAWDQAMAAAAPLAARSKAAEATWRAALISPLDPPLSAKEIDWSRYLYQAVKRLAPISAQRGFDPVWILPAAGAPKFADRARDIREVITEWDEKSDLAFASPSAPEALARVLTESAKAAPAGRLAGSRLFVALPPAQAEVVRTALSRTGATVIVFDPAVPIPQRSEALREIGVALDQAEAEAARATAEAHRFEAEAVRLDALAPPESKAANGDAEALEEMADQLEEEAEKAERTDRKPK
ncbi:hypothetical protein [Sphingomonas sp. PB4P5]|uniref:hypothetical protein n=1 Tax=Parasphingomonas puruogangriensis TaxID=3096155 RepID=UPI002FC7EF08